MGCDCGKPGRPPQRVRIVKGKMVYIDDEKKAELAAAASAAPPTTPDTETAR